MTVVPATWEAEVGGSLEPGVQFQPGKHSETPSSMGEKEEGRKEGRKARREEGNETKKKFIQVLFPPLNYFWLLSLLSCMSSFYSSMIFMECGSQWNISKETLHIPFVYLSSHV
jgi:hypothetical protein